MKFANELKMVLLDFVENWLINQFLFFQYLMAIMSFSSGALITKSLQNVHFPILLLMR